MTPPALAPVTWISDIAFENKATIDGRFIGKEAIGVRELPLTLMAMTVNSGEGHTGSYVAGRIDAVSRDTHKNMKGEKLADGAVAIRGQGQFDMGGENGAEIARLVGDETLRGISVDLAVHDYTFRDPETGDLLDKAEMDDAQWERAFFGELQLAVTDATMVAATVCPTPAFDGANIAITASATPLHKITITTSFEIVTAESLLAAANFPLRPPREWFELGEPGDPTPLTITEEGQVFGHLALWNACHTGLADICTQPPRSQSSYAYFHVGELETDDGDCVAVGKLMFAGKHAPLNLTRMAASKHYDDHSHVGAYVRAVDGHHGIWVSGALRSDLTQEEVVQIRANPPSGDWRGVNGGLELIAALSVPVPGYPIPRAAAALAASGDEIEITGLVVTSGAIPEKVPDEGAAQRRIEVLVAAADPDPIEALASLAGT